MHAILLLLAASDAILAGSPRVDSGLPVSRDKIPRIDAAWTTGRSCPIPTRLERINCGRRSPVWRQAGPGRPGRESEVGWVKGQNHLYFYEAFDDYWDFARNDLHNDIFEVVVDGDRSGDR